MEKLDLLSGRLEEPTLLDKLNPLYPHYSPFFNEYDNRNWYTLLSLRTIVFLWVFCVLFLTKFIK